MAFVQHIPPRFLRRLLAPSLVFALFCATLANASDIAHIKLLTGDVVSGPLLSASDQGLVIEYKGLPYGIAYGQMEATSAYRNLREGLMRRHYNTGAMQSQDYLRLGRLALDRDLIRRARRDFALASKTDPSLESEIADAWDRHRQSTQDVPLPADDETIPPSTKGDADSESESPLAFSGAPDSLNGDLQQQQRITDGYKQVGEKICARLGSDVTLVETDHFLIWTDWIETEHPLLSQWCERMFDELSRRFDVPPDQPVFAGKCPIFCLRSKDRFVKAAKLLDGYDAPNAVGYTSRSTNGHVHVVVRRLGGTAAGRDAFAATLVHEGTHAFLHRYRNTRSIPAWLNEGLAEFVAEFVLGERCWSGEAAAATAREIVSGNYSIAGVFSDTAMLKPRFYPVAHALVAFLVERDPIAFSRLIDDIKGGVAAERSLIDRFGLTYDGLDRAWRERGPTRQQP